MNWGTKLVLAMGMFMAFIIALTVKMMVSDKDDLVDKNYYEKGLNYDHDYQRKQNVLNDKAEPAVNFSDKDLRITFKDQAKGTVRLYHPSDNSRDKTFKLDTDDSGQMVLPLAELGSGGQWKLSAEWESRGRKYLYEKYVFIP